MGYGFTGNGIVGRIYFHALSPYTMDVKKGTRKGYLMVCRAISFDLILSIFMKKIKLFKLYNLTPSSISTLMKSATSDPINQFMKAPKVQLVTPQSFLSSENSRASKSPEFSARKLIMMFR